MDMVKANEYDAIRLYEHFRSKKKRPSCWYFTAKMSVFFPA